MLRDYPLLHDDVALGLRGRDLVSVQDLSVDEIYRIFHIASVLKSDTRSSVPHRVLEGKSLGMIFKKSSTRTRVSFEVGIWQLGGHGLFLSADDIQMSRGESMSDTAEVLSRYLDGIMIRTYSHDEVVQLAASASVPVVNGLTDLLHPCQALADLFTAFEKKGDLSGLKLAFIGDGNNVAHSLLVAGSKLGVNVSIASPPRYEPQSFILDQAMSNAASAGTKVEVVHDPFEAARDADIVYTDVWASMGQELEKVQREKNFAGYQVNGELMAVAKPDALVMHCLPAHRGEEITAEVIDGPNSVVLDEAENRLHVQKAIMVLLML
jgi:ornithine carbamoyltransferase